MEMVNNVLTVLKLAIGGIKSVTFPKHLFVKVSVTYLQVKISLWLLDLVMMLSKILHKP